MPRNGWPLAALPTSLVVQPVSTGRIAGQLASARGSHVAEAHTAVVLDDPVLPEAERSLAARTSADRPIDADAPRASSHGRNRADVEDRITQSGHCTVKRANHMRQLVDTRIGNVKGRRLKHKAVRVNLGNGLGVAGVQRLERSAYD